ncbi:DLA class II histocompatibility antigen, DR-1 beta chain-like, partial [Protobothrops mucrosquamatus]|uniref:DLA class II histocompatibility antigen, DR-1 beta chain-like n=1 Tax=Protobothrops mucrosquamatus TaxID=103944 RepID=UPI0010FB6024
HFLYQEKQECHFLNGTRRVRYVYRDTYDRQEIVRFDSARGEFEAVSALGKADAEDFNRDKRILQDAKSRVDRFCRHNYEVFQGGPVLGRRAHFLYQGKCECRFLNGTRRVQFLERYIYDRQEYLRFDSARGEYEALTAPWQALAQAWNRDERRLQIEKTGVDRFCRNNYEVSQSGSAVGRREGLCMVYT